MKKIFFLFCIFAQSIVLQSSPFIELRHINLIDKIRLVESTCDLNFKKISAYPYVLKNIYDQTRRFISNNSSEKCHHELKDLENLLLAMSIDNESIIGYQYADDKHLLQDRGNKYYDNSLVYFNSTVNAKNTYLNFRISNDINTGKAYLDGSYFSLLYKNHVISIGKIDRWWSPSRITSPILSNNARPQLGISFENYLPLNFENYFAKYFKNINYLFFVNKLEKDRHIPNALLFGNRINFNINDRLDISLVRTAQFGGDNRPTDTNTIIDMLLGKDNTNRNLSFEEQAGNQLAGIDFNYIFTKAKNKLSFYGQILGEDGLDPLNENIDFIKFPSKRFGQLGMLYEKNSMDYIFEYINTYNGAKNNTYGHSLYKSGYRHYGKSIGANIDADSISYIIYLKKYFDSGSTLSVKFQRADINKHNSDKNFLAKNNFIFNEISTGYKFNLYKNFDAYFNFIARKSKLYGSENSFLIRIEYLY